MSMEILVNNYPVQIKIAEGREKPRVAFLGPKGTYTEEATHTILNGNIDQFDLSLLANNGEVVRRVNDGDFDIGIVPVENSTEGDVMEVLRELVRAHRVNVLGETIRRIEHMLIGRPGEPIEEIYSHVQALGQCRAFLLANYPQARQISTPSTADGVEQIKDKPNAAAIASRRVAEMSGLSILAENIGDMKGNSTRFLMIGRGETQPTGEDTTSLVFVPKEDYPGILWECLGVFRMHGINLTKIDSHPTGRLREYMFMASLDGHQVDDIVRRALTLLEEQYCSSIRRLGSYRKAQLPEGVREPGAINGVLN